MFTLAIETTHRAAGLALLDDRELVGQWSLDSPRRSAAALAVGVRTVLDQAGLEPRQIDLVAVATGPGSFTGLRVGVTTAKTLAYACGAEVIGIGTLEAIAAAAAHQAGTAPLWTIVDAHRGQVFAARYARRDAPRAVELATHIVDVDEWLARLAPGDVVAGPPLDQLVARLPAGVRATDAAVWAPQASTIGRLAVDDFQAGRRDDVWQLVPQYFRPSAAEEKRAAAGEA